jgi:hypothetical protein
MVPANMDGPGNFAGNFARADVDLGHVAGENVHTIVPRWPSGVTLECK